MEFLCCVLPTLARASNVFGIPEHKDGHHTILGMGPGVVHGMAWAEAIQKRNLGKDIETDTDLL